MFSAKGGHFRISPFLYDREKPFSRLSNDCVCLLHARSLLVSGGRPTPSYFIVLLFQSYKYYRYVSAVLAILVNKMV